MNGSCQKRAPRAIEKPSFEEKIWFQGGERGAARPSTPDESGNYRPDESGNYGTAPINKAVGNDEIGL